jgi:hypothetical protein
MTSPGTAQDLLDRITEGLDQGRTLAVRRVQRFDSRDLDEETEDSLRDLAQDLRNELHHIVGLLQEVLHTDLPALKRHLS